MFRLSLLFFHFTSFSSLNSSDMFYSKCYLCYTEGKMLKTLGVQSVGEVISVSSSTFTSRLGVWIYTWDKTGKRISTRGVQK